MFVNAFKSLGRQWAGFLALFFVLTTGSAYALAGHNTVFSDDIVNGAVKSKDVRDASLTGGDVADESLTGSDIDESSLGTVPDAGTVGGKSPSDLLDATIYKKESVVGPGTQLGDGTFVHSATCDPGDILLSGGPANMSGTSDLIETFPSGAVSSQTWSVRIDKNGLADNFNVVILCVDQG